ncbi:MAG: tRNA (adenosine(37)-N6)-threonylcarbamoyltransferase complex ATPase subunit type 1 TsaE [Bacilli bacterium]|nr:tRNA (adenosine(37)-N6)-threonylcarbamoyltransferase complex ATPase subunit type 1 TsaE [Bacilli bacterium]
MVFVSSSSAETIKLGKMLASSFKGGEVVLAIGDLGAGKTAFCKGIALGLGIKQIVNSPTFNIMKVYSGKRLNLYHIDAYRLEDKDAITDIGFDESIGNKDGISYIEWPKFIESYYIKESNIITVKITSLSKNKRRIEIEEGIKYE